MRAGGPAGRARRRRVHCPILRRAVCHGGTVQVGGARTGPSSAPWRARNDASPPSLLRRRLHPVFFFVPPPVRRGAPNADARPSRPMRHAHHYNSLANQQAAGVHGARRPGGRPRAERRAGVGRVGVGQAGARRAVGPAAGRVGVRGKAESGEAVLHARGRLLLLAGEWQEGAPPAAGAAQKKATKGRQAGANPACRRPRKKKKRQWLALARPGHASSPCALHCAHLPLAGQGTPLHHGSALKTARPVAEAIHCYYRHINLS